MLSEREFTEISLSYYASQPAREWAKGRVCNRCHCHLNFEHHPLCNDLSVSDSALLERIEQGGGDIGQDWLWLPMIHPALKEILGQVWQELEYLVYEKRDKIPMAILMSMRGLQAEIAKEIGQVPPEYIAQLEREAKGLPIEAGSF